MAYAVPTYLADMVTLLARVNAQQVDWVGTSMGGLIGMSVACLPGSPIRRLVLNDVGPRIELSGITRIASYVGQSTHWASEDAAADALWAVSTSFGPHTREQWMALTRPLLKPDGQGGWMLRYDPAIATPFKAMTPALAAAGEAMLWQAYDNIKAATLVLRGAESDLLSRETARAMTLRGPHARLHEVAGVGHAPMLVQADQRAVLREFLLAA
jgi:pimeloyl-ACP methyl ester carboxylesterase